MGTEFSGILDVPWVPVNVTDYFLSAACVLPADFVTEFFFRYLVFCGELFQVSLLHVVQSAESIIDLQFESSFGTQVTSNDGVSF